MRSFEWNLFFLMSLDHILLECWIGGLVVRESKARSSEQKVRHLVGTTPEAQAPALW